MEPRLLPINAVLGLLVPGDVNPAALFDAGFRLAGLEVPVVGPDGRVVADMVLFHAARSHLVLVEAKSGANVEDSQARRYAALDPIAVVQATGVTVPQRDELAVETVYACLDQHASRIRQGLDHAGVHCALIRVAERSITLDRPTPSDSPLDAAWASGPIELAGPVVRLLPFDHDSDASAFTAVVRAQLVAELAQRRTRMTVRTLAELVVPYFAMFANSAQQQLIGKVRVITRTIADEEPSTYRYWPKTETQREDTVEFLRTPEERDPRGRTQAYQAMHGRRGRGIISSEQRQMDLLDMLAETSDDDVPDDTQDED